LNQHTDANRSIIDGPIAKLKSGEEV